MVRRWLIVWVVLLLSPACAMGAELVATVDHNRVGKDNMILLSVRLTGSDAHFQLNTSPLDKDFYVIPKGSGRKAGQWREKRFQLGPKHTGVLTIPALLATLNGQTLVSQPFQITVLNRSGNIDDTRLWIKTHVDRNTAWQRQQVVYRFTVFSTSPLVSPSLAPPDFSGFSVDVVKKNAPGEQIIDGRRMVTADYEYLLFPEQSGNLSIPGPVIKATLVHTVKSFRMAAGQASIDDEKHQFLFKSAVGAPESIQVRPLPAAAMNLPVGILKVHSGITEAKAIAGEPLTWTVNVQGTGIPGEYLPDLKHLMTLGSSFKVYPETPDISQIKRHNGVITNAIWRQVILPQKQGSLTLPPIALSYFNPDNGQIEKSYAPAVALNVAPPLQRQGDVVFRANPSMVGYAGHQVQIGSRWWKWIAATAFFLWLTTLALWLLPARKFAAWFKNRGARSASLRQVLSARDAFEQFTRLKIMLGLPSRLSPLGFLELYPQLKDSQAGPWLERLEQGRYAVGEEEPPALDDRSIRKVRTLVERSSASAPRFIPAAFGRIGAGR